MTVDRSVLVRLNDAKDYASEAAQIASLGDISSRDCLAVRYCLMVIGEALSSVPADILAGEPSTPWRRIIALRHRLVHGYRLIDENLVLEVARNKTAALIAALERLIEKLK